ncbi:MAG: hypothetical protein HQK83_01500 [Fibrobacteria bacterium]|nr:hypothetical protein [Fibrobacteria bacterium]
MRLDKSAYSHSNQKRQNLVLLKLSAEELLRMGMDWSLRVAGYDPLKPPRMDKKAFSMRKRA